MEMQIQIWILFVIISVVAGSSVSERCFAPVTCSSTSSSHPDWLQVYPPPKCNWGELEPQLIETLAKQLNTSRIESNIAQQFENKFLHVNAQLETEASNRKMDYLNITTQLKDFKDFVAHRQNVTNNDLAMGFMEVFEQISELSANHSQDYSALQQSVYGYVKLQQNVTNATLISRFQKISDMMLSIYQNHSRDYSTLGEEIARIYVNLSNAANQSTVLFNIKLAHLETIIELNKQQQTLVNQRIENNLTKQRNEYNADINRLEQIVVTLNMSLNETNQRLANLEEQFSQLINKHGQDIQELEHNLTAQRQEYIAADTQLKLIHNTSILEANERLSVFDQKFARLSNELIQENPSFVCGNVMIVRPMENRYIHFTAVDYINYFNCTFRLKSSNSNSKIFVSVSMFGLENAPCSRDHLAIYDGDTTFATSFGTYCGTTNPPTNFTSTGDTMTVWFNTDLSVKLNGFRMDYQIAQ